MSYDAKNYFEQGGGKLVIGGEIEILEGAKITGLPKAVNQKISTADSLEGLVNDFNALLAKLKTVGLMAADAEE